MENFNGLASAILLIQAIQFKNAQLLAVYQKLGKVDKYLQAQLQNEVNKLVA